MRAQYWWSYIEKLYNNLKNVDIGFGLLITYLYLCNFRNHKRFYYFKDGDIRISKFSF